MDYYRKLFQQTLKKQTKLKVSHENPSIKTEHEDSPC